MPPLRMTHVSFPAMLCRSRRGFSSGDLPAAAIITTQGTQIQGPDSKLQLLHSDCEEKQEVAPRFAGDAACKVHRLPDLLGPFIAWLERGVPHLCFAKPSQQYPEMQACKKAAPHSCKRGANDKSLGIICVAVRRHWPRHQPQLHAACNDSKFHSLPFRFPSRTILNHHILMSATPKRTGPFAQAWYKWKALRLPWRKRFLIGTL